MKSLLFAALLTSSALALATGSNCPAQFFSGHAPDIHNPKLAQHTKPLCFDSFAVLYSGISLTPLWSAEHITRQRVQQARDLVRTDSFHEEPQLQNMPHPTLEDYARSGYDRGHMSPNGDMADKESQHQSFSLANMIPQSPENNRGIWAGIESSVRDLAVRDGEVYVVTGPFFEGDSITRLNDRVLIPTHLYKAVYDPRKQQAAAYITPNAPGENYQVVSIAELENRIGINPFPGLSETARQRGMPLPPPKPSAHGGTHSNPKAGNKANSGESAFERWIERELYRMLKQWVRSL